MFQKATFITASTLAVCTAANADIVYSGPLFDGVSDVDGGQSLTIEIAIRFTGRGGFRSRDCCDSRERFLFEK